MMKKRRLVALLLALTFVLSFTISGCGTQGGTDADKSSDTSTAASDASKTAEAKVSTLAPYEMTVYYMCGAVPADLEAVQTEMSKYLTEKINATVKLMPIEWGAWEDKTKLALVSGDKIDYIASHAAIYPANVAKGAYLPLNDLLPQYGKDIVSLIGMDRINGTAIGGKIYGIPVWKEFGKSAGFIFKKELVDKYGFDLNSIKKLEDLEPMFKTIKEKEPDIIPFNSSGRYVSDTFGSIIADQIGGIAGVLRYDSKDYKVISAIADPELVNLFRWTRKMFQADYINKSALTDKDEGPMKAGKAFSMPYELKPGKDAELSAAWGFPVVQKEMAGPVSPSDAAKGIMGAIGKTSKDPARVMMFMNLMYTDAKLLNLFVFGIENKHYVKVNDTTIKSPDGVDPNTIGYKNEPWMFGNQFLNYLRTTEDPQKWEKYKQFNASAKLSPVMGFGFDPTNVKTEIANMANVAEKYGKALKVGAVDVDTTIAKMNEEAKAAGEDKIIQEKQKQLDEWLKLNKK